MGGGHGGRHAGKASVDEHGGDAQSLPHGGAGPVEPQEGDLCLPQAESAADALVQKVSGADVVQLAGGEAAPLQGLSLIHIFTNSHALRRELESQGSIFQTTTDSEVIAYLIVQERLRHPSIEAAVSAAMGRLEGAYSLVISSPSKLIAVRDPHRCV